jgi:hypothetical protein
VVQPAEAWPLPEITLPGTITSGVDTTGWTVDPDKARITVTALANGLLIEADVRDTDLRAPHTARDASMHEGDAFEIFLQCATGSTFYMELQIAPNGAFMDNFMLDRFWGRYGTADMPDWDIKGYELTVTPRGTINQPNDVDEGYSLRLLIPPTALKGNPHWPVAGQTWRGNFVIVDNGGTSSVPRVWQWAASLREGGFPHEQERFGWIHTAPSAPGAKP